MANGDINLATLWVPVAPETSQVGPAMEQAGKEAKGKFGDAVKGIGNTIQDDLAKAGAKAKDAFSGVGKHITDTFSRAGRESGKSLTDSLSGAIDSMQRLASHSDKASGNVHSLTDALSGVKSGDLESVSGAIGKIGEGAKNIGVDIDGWAGPLQNVAGKSAEAKSQINEFAEIIKGMPGHIGKMGESLAGLATPLAAIIGTLHQIDNDPALKDLKSLLQGTDHPPAAVPPGHIKVHVPGLGDIGVEPGSIAADVLPQSWQTQPQTPGVTPLTPNSGVGRMLLPGGPAGSGPLAPGQYPGNFVGPIPLGATRAPTPPSTSNFYNDWYGGNPNTTGGSGGSGGSGGTGGSSGGGRSGGGGGGGGVGTPTDRQGLYAAGARVSNLYAFAASLVGTPYSTQLRNDCSGMVAELSAVALGLPVPSAGERFSTDNEGAWLASHGFQQGMGPAGSFRVGWHNGGPGGGHTAATLPDGTHAEQGGSHGSFTLGAGAAGAEDSQFEHHAYLPADKIAGLGASGGRSPIGTEHDPLYVSQTGGSEGGLESQGQQLGQGLVSGVLEMFGLDGSVLKGFGSGKSPLDFGIVKLFGGVANSFLHMGQSAGGVGGGDGAMLPGMGSMIPGLGALLGPGAAISAGAVPANGAGKTADASGGSTTIIQGDYAPYNVHGVGTVQEQQQQYLSSNRTQGMITANAGGLPG